ncbi:adenylate/guanylate cyclase domain-containing protein [Ruegeria arenilitoris]|uniref:adenylate/guanylate cyclase domain-containing protein n=1 Tax=Ruegeria arenilitoris TaxID=1173585 RepID=UPI00147E1CF4|nr:adenylate/guanylate cyclase domain-containing protein [Ruegeria arenilitoris]
MSGDATKRKLTTIVAADVVEFSRLISADEEGTLASLRAHRAELIDPKIAEHEGRIANTAGDSLLVEFPSVVDAVRCMLEIQSGMDERNAEIAENQQIQLRVGINVGDVVAEGEDLLGDGVNVAARLEALSEQGGICLSRAVRDQIRDRMEIALEDLGEVEVKNIARPVRVFRVKSSVGGGPVVSAPLEPEQPLPSKPSIAVLPFNNMSGDPEQEYFADGMVEDIITALSRLDQLFVIARNSSFTYKGRSVDVRQVSKELGVRYLLEGSVRKAGGRIRITGQLIEGASGAHLWADNFDGSVEDVFDLQDQITESVVGAIEPTLRKAEIERSRRIPPENLDAYDLYLRALPHAYAMQPDENSKALRLLNDAIEHDPNYAPALANAAWCYEQRLTRGWETTQVSDAATSVALARRAVATNSDDANALATAGFVLLMVDRDYDVGLTTIDRALSINPNTAPISMFAGWANTFAGRPDIALTCFQRALQLSPTDPGSFFALTGTAMAQLLSDQPEQASEMAGKSMALNPGWDTTQLVLAAASSQLGRPLDSVAAVERLLEIAPGATVSLYEELLRFKCRRHLDVILDGLRAGGMPE